MNLQNFVSKRLLALATAVLLSAGLTTANADEPCPPDGDFGECKVLIEINATDGDIGFHFLVDGDDLISTTLKNPDGKIIFRYVARHELRQQFVTETFVESAEPLCWENPEELEELEEGEELDIVTLEEFLDLWSEGMYHFNAVGDGGELSHGETELTFDLPAAPADLQYVEKKKHGDVEGEISWIPGDDLGNCSDGLDVLVADGVLPDPEGVPVAAWEVVFEPDVEDGDPTGALVFSVRVPAEQLSVTVPADYRASLGDDMLVKIEVGAIGFGDNATFTEIFDICVNEVDGCEDDD